MAPHGIPGDPWGSKLEAQGIPMEPMTKQDPRLNIGILQPPGPSGPYGLILTFYNSFPFEKGNWNTPSVRLGTSVTVFA